MKRSKIKGTSVVEFAIVAPIFLMIFLATMGLGVAIYNKVILTHAVREGARQGVAPKDPAATAAEIENKIKDAVKSYVGDGSTFKLITFGNKEPITIEIDGVIGEFGDPLKVTAKYKYEALLYGKIWAPELASQVIMTHE